MSAATEKTSSVPRPILAPTGNRVRIIEEQRRKKEMKKKPPEKVVRQSPAKPAAAAVLRRDISAESSSDSSSSASSSSGSIVKSAQTTSSRRTKNRNGAVRAAKNVPGGVGALSLSPAIKRCDWITPNSEPVYTCFHDEEWGVPVHDDAKLLELLVYSQALAELSWPLILNRRPLFRKVFNDFDPTSVANLDEERLLSVRVQGCPLLSEPKVRAIINNAKQILNIQQEFGSFSNYSWGFVNHKPIKSGFRYARQVGAKTPKSDLISKDLMQRGFRCVGPTIVYSFMQAAGLVNNHLVTCYRYSQCTNDADQVPTTQGSRTTT